MMYSGQYIDLLLWAGWIEFVNEEIHEEIKRFVYHIYEKKSTSCLDESR